MQTHIQNHQIKKRQNSNTHTSGPIPQRQKTDTYQIRNEDAPYMGTYKTPQNSPDIHTDHIITGRTPKELADQLKKMFLMNEQHIITRSDLVGIMSTFKLESTLRKRVVHPTSCINIMTRFENLQISDLDIKFSFSEPEYYKSYGSDKTPQYLFTIFDMMGINVLYLIGHNENNHNVYYLSPLNIRKFRDTIRKTGKQIIKHEDLNKYTHALKTKFNVQHRDSFAEINTSVYDVIMICSSFKTFTENKYKIVAILNSFDDDSDYRASILTNRLNNHQISVSKCNGIKISNTTAPPFYTYQIKEFLPGKYAYYTIPDIHKLTDLEKKEIKDINQYIPTLRMIRKPGSVVHSIKPDYYYSHYYDKQHFHESLDNIHLFSSKRKLIQPIIRGAKGGSLKNLEHAFDREIAIPPVSVCNNIFFQNNLYGYCWFSSIVNSLFYTDDISVIFLNKVTKKMNATLEYVKNFVTNNYSTFDINDDKQLKEFTQHLMYIFIYVYCSFSILSKGQYHEIVNKQLWIEIYTKLTGEYYDYVYIYIILLSKPTPIIRRHSV